MPSPDTTSSRPFHSGTWLRLTQREKTWLQQDSQPSHLAGSSDKGDQVPADGKQHQCGVEVDHVGWTASKRESMLKGWTTAVKVTESSVCIVQQD